MKVCGWVNGGSGPAEVDAGELVEAAVEGAVEVAQALERQGVDGRMTPPLAAAQAVRRAAALALQQAREPLGGVEVEVLLRDHALQTQERLHAGQLLGGVHHQSLPADEQELGVGEILQPALQGARVQTQPHRAPRRVHQVTCNRSSKI